MYGLDIVSPEKIGVEKTFSWKDLEAGALPEVDVIIHLAGKAHDTKKEAILANLPAGIKLSIIMALMYTLNDVEL